MAKKKDETKAEEPQKEEQATPAPSAQKPEAEAAPAGDVVIEGEAEMQKAFDELALDDERENFEVSPPGEEAEAEPAKPEEAPKTVETPPEEKPEEQRAAEDESEPKEPEKPPVEEKPEEKPAEAKPEAEPKPEEKKEPEAAPSTEEPVVKAPEQEPPQTPEELAAAQKEWRKNTVEQLATEHFALDEETKAAFGDEASHSIARLQAKTFLDAVENSVQAVAQLVPQMIEQHLGQKRSNDELEQAFFTQWPALNKKDHGKTIMRFATAYRQAHPQMDATTFIRDVGVQVHVAEKIPLPGTESAQPPEEKTPPTPTPPVSTGGPGGKPAPEQNFYGTLAEEELEEFGSAPE